jgi:hypothetical protein
MGNKNELSGKEQTQNFMEKAVGRMMSGGKHNTDGDPGYQIEIGKEYGRTQFSEEAIKSYEKTRGNRATLNSSEYYAVTMGFLREHVCMAQCNLYLQILKNPMLQKSMLTYRRDVCEPNLTEMKKILEDGGYELPATYNGVSDARDINELGSIETDAIDDRMLLIGHIFSVEGFMNRWNQGAILSHRAEVRDAFLRNYHRANRWHLAAIEMAEKMEFIEPQPEIKLKESII